MSIIMVMVKITVMWRSWDGTYSQTSFDNLEDNKISLND
jgi:hypothetical protein